MSTKKEFYKTSHASIEKITNFEDNLCLAIREGNNEHLKLLWKTPFHEELRFVNITANTIPYIILPVLALMRRSAIEGGASADDVFEVYDSTISTSLNKRTPLECVEILTEASYKLCNLVRSTKKLGPYTLYARKCEKYIQAHVREKITIQDLANLCSLSTRQISRIFSECFKLGVTQYIHGERIKLAQLMLKDENMSVIDISNHFGYSSQSHFTKTFVKYSGCTPNEYRKKFI